GPALEIRQPPLEGHVLVVVLLELGIPVEQGLDQILVFSLHSTPLAAGKSVRNMRQIGLSTRAPSRAPRSLIAARAQPGTAARTRARACRRRLRRRRAGSPSRAAPRCRRAADTRRTASPARRSRRVPGRRPPRRRPTARPARCAARA